jgi:hypothetical protein
MSDAHYYLTAHHVFEESELDYLLLFQDPLEVVTDVWALRREDISDFSFALHDVFDKKDALHGNYALAEDTDEARSRAEKTLLERENVKISKAAAYIVETSALCTEYGNYITYPGGIPDDIMTADEFKKYKDRIADEILEYEAVAQVDVGDDCSIDVTMYLAYCPNYIPHPEEREEYPDDREILDALQSKAVREPEKPPFPERKPSLLGKLEQNKQKAAQAGRPDASERKPSGREV